VSGSAPCDDCLAGKYSAATGASTAATCLSCMSGKFSNGTGASTSATCQNCIAGKYSAAIGQNSSETCQDCVPGKYSAATGASTAATCLNCDAGSYAATQASSACSLCPSGKYSNAIAASTTCQDCLAGKYSAATGASTVATCQNCSAGSYSATPASPACTLCPSGKYSAAGTGQSSSATCEDCLAGKFSMATGQNSSKMCLDCLEGKYATLTGSSACTQCPALSISPVGSTASTQCTCSYAGVNGPLSSLHGPCTCNPGYTGVDGIRCRMCPWRYYKSSSGTDACTTCGSAVTIPGVPATSVADCKPPSNDMCVSGAGGTFNTWLSGQGPCVSCPPNSVSDQKQCFCNLGFGGGGGYMIPGHALPPSHGFAITEVVNAGCTACSLGQYSQDFWTSPKSCLNCNDFMPHSTTEAAACTQQSNCCKCKPGYHGETIIASKRYCQPCPANTFKSIISNGGCSGCGPTTSTFSYSQVIGATSSDSCGCNIGYYYNPTEPGYSNGACRGCPYGKYQPFVTRNTTCIDCPFGTTTDTIGTSLNDCKCMPGFIYAGAPGNCTACPVGKYKWGINNNVVACSNCPCGNGWASLIGTTPVTCSTTEIGKPAAEDKECFCPPGYSGPAGSACGACLEGTYKNYTGFLASKYTGDSVILYIFPCHACPAGTYTTARAATACITCPSNSFSQGPVNIPTCLTCADSWGPKFYTIGGTSITSCVCNSGYEKVGTSLNFTCQPLACSAGYTGPAGSCVACLGGTYKNTVGSDACTSCPRNSSSPSGSSALTACQCNAGFSGANGGTCSACGAGSYKATVGSVACTLCGANTYSPSNASISATSCLACPGNSTSVAGSSVCQCKSGYSGPDGGPCEACSVGFYKTTAGAANCTRCPENAVSTLASTTLASCKCVAGHSGPDGGLCTACVPGRFKATVGSVACTLCPVNTYSSSNASISATSCLACPRNASSVAGSSVCLCDIGYSGADGGPCEVCSVGFYKTTAGAANCTRCPVNAVSALGSTTLQSCKCDAGHSGLDGGLCTACAAGSYKPTVGSVACTLCGVNAYGTTLAAISNTSCVGCAGNSTSVRGSDKPELCFCKAGYEQTKDFDACIECRPGFYDNMTNRHECSMCGGGLYSAFWGATGPETCKECGPGTWSEIGSATCSLCPPNSNSSARSVLLTDCKCIPGASGQDGQTCELCEAGEYKASVGNASCTRCSENSFSVRASTRCLCNIGYTGPDSGNCTACEAGKYKNVSGSTLCSSCARNSSSPAASIDRSSCVCNAGYENKMGTSGSGQHEELNCTACTRGKYKAAGTGVCASCPENFTPISGSAASACECDVGYRQANTSDHWCGSCKIGTFKNRTGNMSWAYGISASDGCVVDDGCCQCPQNRTTLSVATVESVECLCMRGFGGSACKVCSAGKYKDNISMGECVSCPFGSTTVDMGSSAVSNCVAALGHYGNLTAGFTACANGSYAPRTGMQQCIPCPPGATSPLGAVSDVLCVCELTGWTRSLGNTSDLCSCRERFARNPGTRLCELCKANYSCAGGDLPAQPCANASVSPSGSANTTDCVCMAGYSGVDGGPCVGCGKGEWKAVNGSSQCIKCVNNSMSVERSTSVKSCLCKPGYTGEDGGPCTACELGSYKEEEGAFACRNCTANTTTVERGSSKYLNCLCNSGFELVGMSSSSSQNITICASCAVGKYKQAPGLPQVCVSCPAYATTLRVGSIVHDECVCVPGWYSALNSSSCQMCAENSFKASAGNAACTLCSPNATSAAGSNTSSACQCVRGFTGPNGGACVQCMPGQYKTVIGSSACLQCVANSISPGGSINATACVCNAGFVGGGPCSACARDTYAYKNTVTNPTGVCMPCPAYSKSEPQSSALTSCKCLLGYGGAAGGPCTPCGLAYYRGSTHATCRQCPRYTNTTSLIAESAAECVAIAGYVTGVVQMPSVNLTMVLPYSLEQLTEDVLAKLKRGIAAAAQVACGCNMTEQHVFIMDVKPFSQGASGTRRLLQASAPVEVTHIIEVPTDEDVQEILNLMSLSNINTALQAQGVNGSTYNISKVPNTEDIVYATPCPQNTYKTSLSNMSCSSCPPQSSAPSGSSSIDACKCAGNLMKNRQGFCDRECAAGFEARTSMDVGGQMVTACAPCLKSFYKASAGSQDCTRCPSNSFSLLYNQTSVTSCMCEQGYIWNSVSNLCDACPPGTSNNNYNESVCYLCNTTCPADVI